eukprot:6854426-Alexandrium_andersonii.AAC.1
MQLREPVLPRAAGHLAPRRRGLSGLRRGPEAGCRGVGIVGLLPGGWLWAACGFWGRGSLGFS